MTDIVVVQVGVGPAGVSAYGSTKLLSASSYMTSATDTSVYVDTAAIGAQCNVTLATPINKPQRVLIKDATGQGNSHHIVVSAGSNIDGAATYTISTAYGWVELEYGALPGGGNTFYVKGKG